MDTEHVDLSELDQPLLNALHDNGRASFSALGRELGVPRQRVERRMNELLATGQLTITAQVHPAILGLHVYCHLLIRVAGSSAALIRNLEELPEIILISAIAGGYDVVAEIGAHDAEQMHLTLQTLREMPGIRSVVGSQHVAVLKSRFNAETLLVGTAPRLDARDHRLIELLRRNGRMPFRELASEVGLSTASARSRVHHLINSGAVTVTAVPSTKDAPRSFLMGVGVNLNGSPEHLTDVVHRLPSVEFAATTIGRFDAVLTMSSRSLGTLHAHLDALRQTPGIGVLESWLRIEMVRESYE